MKKLLTILAVSVFVFSSIQAQRIVKVAPDKIDELAIVIKGDSTARRAAAPQQTIYELERNGYYPIISAIENEDFFLYIRAEAGTDPKPYLQASPTAANTYTYKINMRSNVKLEGLILDASTPTSSVLNRHINVYNGASVWFKNCEIAHDRGGAVAIQSNDCSIYMDDCFVHSIGYPKGIGGNGRVIDLRSITSMDSVVVRNTTFFNLSDRIMRSAHTITNYVEFDHCTGLVTSGFHGGLQSGKAKVLKITNNIFRNTITFGAVLTRVQPGAGPIEQYQPAPEDQNMWVVTVDTSSLFTPKITVRNNNVYWEKKYSDLWAKYSTITKAPGVFTPTIMKGTADSTKAFFAEELAFKNEPTDIVAFTDSALANSNATTFPENWWYNFQEPYSPVTTVDASYGTTAISYTAGDNGFPLGDLNWYPAKKAQWLVTEVGETEANLIPTSIELSQNYPNPFNPVTIISYSVPSEMKVKLTIFDMLGREVTTLVNQVQQAGQYKVDFDASKLSTGVYVYRLSTPNSVISKKMMLVK